MSYPLQILIAIIAPYLLGSISSAIITSKIMRLPDPRSSGSGNPGATNVLRVGGKKAAIITLVGDLLKGLIPVEIALLLGADATIIAITGFAAIIGHVFPAYYHFKGGKGVATSLGVILGLNLQLAIIIIAVWLLIFVLFKYSSLAAITAITLSLAYGWGELPLPQYIMLCAVVALLLWRHRSNMVRLIQGKEPPFK
jgi:glycerol-3-phosphate acyltransferase PlsY